MQVMRVSALEENQTGETFSQRADWFYQRRPLILSLCQDLYDGYATLLDHFNHSKPQNPKPQQDHDSDISSEVESILSFQQIQAITTCDKQHNIDELVSQLVTANLEKDISQNELQRREKKLQEASKTIELLKKLVMLLDMEKEVAVEETANLGYKLTRLLEENRELATEALFMKKEAVKLARCVLRMKDEHFHNVCLLQNQIYEMQQQSSRELSVCDNVSTPSCFGLDHSKNSKKRKMSETRSEAGEKKKRSKWFKRLNLFTKCSISPTPASLHGAPF
ncbi:unnamed protein product [Microthlaspi erraticum]|uniref:NAB domain-containing protein n=1 Tax=Microthlaspi erraticum TaxID=1685480 RepID=A0A6D2K8Q7_9BRAS|nr:unnamed protein product [Microthlaspi erraticum]